MKMKKSIFDPVASVWVYMRSGWATWAGPKQALPNIQIFGYERGIHLINGRAQRNIETLASTDMITA